MLCSLRRIYCGLDVEKLTLNQVYLYLEAIQTPKSRQIPKTHEEMLDAMASGDFDPTENNQTSEQSASAMKAMVESQLTGKPIMGERIIPLFNRKQ